MKTPLIGLTLFLIIKLTISDIGLNNVRGVPKSRINLFQPTGKNGINFQCFDGSKVILYTQLNDDYCDCVDGSDEPGTSACPNGHFFCPNIGHSPMFVSASRVNDKICDCCDGSDEFDGGVKCENTCDELGRATRVERERMAAIARKGFAKRQELAKSGQAMKEEKLKDLEPLRSEKATLDPQLQNLDTLKKAAEEKEKKLQDEHRDLWMAARLETKKKKAAAMFLELDSNFDSKLKVEELKVLPYIDLDHNGDVTEDEVKTYLNVEEADLEHFTSNMYDSLKNAKRTYDDEKQLDEAANKDVEEVPGDDLIAEANELRKQYDEVAQKVREIDDKIKEAESFSSADFGSDLAWASLKGQCFEVTVMQYVYKLCPFDNASQKDKGGYGETGLGNFKEWNGPATNKYSKQMYHEGQQCWNGPKRSTEVLIECGEENEVTEVSEPAKCEYQFKFRTPAACSDPDVVHDVHTEL